jgi:predicted transcriptional regulator
MKRLLLGEQELEVLRFVSDHSPTNVRSVVENYGEPKGLARTTILTVMERLRKKGFLHRTKVEGIYAYTPSRPKTDILRGLVENFIERTLNGSLTPFVAYLSETRSLTDEEITELKKLVDSL